MKPNKNAVERAFELAKDGRYGSITVLKKVVAAEGYDGRQLEGRAITKQLREIVRATGLASARSN